MRRNGNHNGNPMSHSRDRLQDLDRELELLRRKRQIMEEEQQIRQTSASSYNSPHSISPWVQPPRNDYIQGRSSFGEQNYANLYESQGAYEYMPRNRRKRTGPAARGAGGAPHWVEEQPKRFRGQQDDLPYHPPSKPWNQQFKAGPKPSPGFKPPPKKFAQAAAAPSPKLKPGGNFAAPKPGPSGGKPPGGKPPGQGYNQAKVDGKIPFNQVILDNKNKVPKKAAGRLEFALGVVFKRLRLRHDNKPYAHLFEHGNAGHRAEVSKLVKQAIRARIRDALFNKVIGDIKSIVDEYDKVFPASTDKQLIEQVLEAETTIKKFDQDLASIQPNSAYLKNLVTKDTAQNYFKRNMNSVLQLALQEMFTKLEKLYSDDKLNSKLTNLMIEIDNEENAPVKPVETPAVAEPVPAETVNTESETPQEEAVAESTNNTEPDAAEKEAEEKVTESIEDRYKKLLTGLVQQELPKLLPDFKEQIIKILDVDREYYKAKLYVNAQTVLMNKAEGSIPRKPLDFIMVTSKPDLPQKVILQEFLAKYRPSTIKKHRNIDNVLYVGFANESNYAEILKQDGTVLDGIRLTIKKSIKVKQEEAVVGCKVVQNEETDEMQGDETKTTEDLNLDKVIDSDLDGQINELLSNIREQEENTEYTVDNKEDSLLADVTQDNDVELIDETKEVITLDDDALNDSTANETANGEEKPEEEVKTGEEIKPVEDTVPTPVTPSVAVDNAPDTPSSVTTRRSSRLKN